LAGRYVIVVGSSVVEANVTAAAIQKKQKLKDKPLAIAYYPRGLTAHEKVAVIPTKTIALAADWCDQMERQLDDIKFFTEEALV
jgi:hypothetical protein